MPRLLVAGYAVFWALLAIAPKHRSDWLLENLLVFAFAGLLLFLRPWMRFSGPAVCLMAGFLVLHTIGAHYTYAETPIGYWMQDWLSLERNHFDRFVHFSFGLLMFLPVREVVAKLARVDAPWRSPFTVASVAFFSSFYEVIEWAAAKIVSPDTALAYLGAQGDVFDAQKDMVLALAGAVTALVVGSLARRWLRRQRSTT